MKRNDNLLQIISCLLAPAILIYSNFFTSNPLAWGDAPYFYPENLKELFSLPLLWDFRNSNFGSPQAGILWLYLPTFIMGFLNALFNLNHEVLVRLIFYFPAVIIGIYGSFKFIHQYSNSFKGSILGSFLYGFNTYILMIIDGGQIGVALGYGLFPITVLGILNYFKKAGFKELALALLALFMISNVDLRISILSIGLALVIHFLVTKSKKLLIDIYKISLLILLTLLFNSFWLIPFVINNGEYSLGRFSDAMQSNSLITLLNALVLFQPHFPLNDFGRVLPTPFYFLFLIPVIFIPIFLNPKKVNVIFSILFLIFVFLAKGVAKPFGELFNLFVNSFPLAVAFRDSTKFYIPLLLIGGLLISLNYSFIEKKFKNRLLFWAIFLYLLLLIQPAFYKQLGGTLSVQNADMSFYNIYQKISSDKGFYRTAWFPEATSLAYSSRVHPAIYANRLYQQRPFASLIEGDYDLFNFLNNDKFNEFLALAGVKYVFYQPNERKKIWTVKELEERNIFLEFVDSIDGFKKVNWDTSFPVYENKIEPTPHIFGVEKSYFIVGGDEVYDDLFKKEGFNLSNQGLVFVESCQFNIEKLITFDESSLRILFYLKSKEDLMYLRFCDQLIPPNVAVKNHWALRTKDQYLKWKYELLEKGFHTLEYDLDKGIAFSTIKDERIRFLINIPKDGEYFIPVRFANGNESVGIEASINGESFNLKNDLQNFTWKLIGPISFKKGDIELIFKNKGGLVILNTFGIIESEDLKNAEVKTAEIIDKFQLIDLNSDNLANEIKNSKQIKVNYRQLNPTEFKFDFPAKLNWIVFTDSYHLGWKMGNDAEPLPFYSMFNGFYLDDNFTKESKIYFSPQKHILPSLFVSLISLAIFIIVFGVKVLRGKKWKRR